MRLVFTILLFTFLENGLTRFNLGWAFWFIVTVTAVQAKPCIDLVPHRNQIPMPSIFLELELESACILIGGWIQSQISIQRSNTTTISPDKHLHYPRLILDHEREEVTFKIATGLGLNWDLNLRLRHVKDWQGSWDNFMRRFHKVTRLPFESRKVRPDGKFLYWQYHPDSNGSEKFIWITEPQKGMGDQVMTLRKGHQFYLGDSEIKWNTRIVYKHPSARDLPTISSGEKDYGISTAAEVSETWFGHPMKWLISLGLVYTGQSIHTLYSQKRTFFSGGAAFSIPLHENLNLTAQNLMASPRYEAPGQELKGMNQWQSILSIGVFYHIEDHQMMLAFTEDLMTNHSEDFSLIFSWKGNYGE